VIEMLALTLQTTCSWHLRCARRTSCIGVSGEAWSGEMVGSVWPTSSNETILPSKELEQD
jgi:hypothetical protein